MTINETGRKDTLLDFVVLEDRQLCGEDNAVVTNTCMVLHIQFSSTGCTSYQPCPPS